MLHNLILSRAVARIHFKRPTGKGKSITGRTLNKGNFLSTFVTLFWFPFFIGGNKYQIIPELI